MSARSEVHDLLALRERGFVFRNRRHAGEVLAELLRDHLRPDAVMLAIPSGGVPVAVPLAERLELTLDVAVVSKMTLPWNSEVGYGAMAFDGTRRLNRDLIATSHLSPEQIAEGDRLTRAKIDRRLGLFRGGDPTMDLAGKAVVLVDDGLASGFTMLVAAQAVRNAGARWTDVAVPTGHRRAADRMAESVDRVFCANIRSGSSFAVAQAYQDWYDVTEEEAANLLRHLRKEDSV